MRAFLTVLGIVASLLALLFFATAFLKGSDIQLIAAGVFGTMCAVCFGLESVIDRIDKLIKKSTGG